LATIAGHLDEEERRRMAGGTAGENSEEYRRFIAQPSANMDDTGFFSVQVIANAIGVWGLEIISYNSSDTRSNSARGNPTSQSAFICNYREHWFTIRKLGNQWFNLNSLLTGPELISDTYLSLFLTQLQTEGYTIYVVCGNLPECTANQMLNLIPAVQSVPPRLINEGLEGN
jgi:ataxin-3